MFVNVASHWQVWLPVLLSVRPITLLLRIMIQMTFHCWISVLSFILFCHCSCLSKLYQVEHNWHLFSAKTSRKSAVTLSI